MGKTLHSLKDLKGLIPKEEPVKKTSTPVKGHERQTTPARVNEEPKVGDMVVLMESDEHGRIQRVDGKTYSIKLDNGLVVSLVKWDFAVTDDKEEERLRNSIFARRRPVSQDEPSRLRYTDYGEIFILRRWPEVVRFNRGKHFSSRWMPLNPNLRNAFRIVECVSASSPVSVIMS